MIRRILALIFLGMACFGVSCSTDSTKTYTVSPKIEINSTYDLYRYFAYCKKVKKYPNSKMQYCKKEISNKEFLKVLKINEQTTKDFEIIPKTTFYQLSDNTLDTTYFFIYGLVQENQLEELRVQSIRGNVHISEITLMDFKGKEAVNNDFNYEGNTLRVIKENKEGLFNYTFISLKDGLLKQIRTYSDSLYFKNRTIKAQINFKHVNIYLPTDSTYNTFTVVKGKVDQQVWKGKGFPRQLLVELDQPINGYKYVALDISFTQEAIDYHEPIRMNLVESNRLKEEFTGLSNGYVFIDKIEPYPYYVGLEIK